jgi:cytoskeleton protein RodZ
MALFSRRKEVPEDAGALPDAPPTSTVSELRPTARRRTVGQLLRETRESFGSDIPRVAAALRIRAAYLEAIEEGRYDRLPGPVYALGFVRAYASHLGLDGDEAVRRFKVEAEGLEAQRDLSFPVPLTERSIPTLAWVLLALILAVCVLGFHYYFSSTARPRPERVSPVPAELAPSPAPSPPPSAAAAPPPAAPAPSVPSPAPVPSPVAVAPAPLPTVPPPPASPDATLSPSTSPAPAASPSPSPASAPSPTAATTSATTMRGGGAITEVPLPAPSPSAPATATTETAPPPIPPAPQSAAIPETPADLGGGHEYGLANGQTRILIRAHGPAWVNVVDKDGKQVFTQILKKGDTYRVPNEDGLTLKTGVAENLSFFVDGQPAPAVAGRLRSNIALDPDRLMAGTAASTSGRRP